MQYKFSLLLSVKDTDFILSDRHGQILSPKITDHGDLVELTTDISLPNTIHLSLTKKSNHGSIVLKAVSLGHLKFNDSDLKKLFVYYHQFGSNRNVEWEYNGRVEFQIFEFSAIKYHLLMNTRI